MKTRYKLAALIVTLAVGIITYRLWLKPEVWLSTSSPDKTYTVELTGNRSRPLLPVVEHEVDFNVLKNGGGLVEGAYAHSGDWFDPSFELSYPEHAWVKENVIRFGSDLSAPADKIDTLLISNNSGKAIKYLRIKAHDMFLILELPPNSTLRLQAPHQSWLSWITGEGEFSDGQRISHNGVNFFHRDKLGESLDYCISIDDDRLKIQSLQLEGYDTKASSENPNVPRAISCRP